MFAERAKNAFVRTLEKLCAFGSTRSFKHLCDRAQGVIEVEDFDFDLCIGNPAVGVEPRPSAGYVAESMALEQLVERILIPAAIDRLDVLIDASAHKVREVHGCS